MSSGGLHVRGLRRGKYTSTAAAFSELGNNNSSLQQQPQQQQQQYQQYRPGGVGGGSAASLAAQKQRCRARELLAPPCRFATM